MGYKERIKRITSASRRIMMRPGMVHHTDPSPPLGGGVS